MTPYVTIGMRPSLIKQDWSKLLLERSSLKVLYSYNDQNTCKSDLSCNQNDSNQDVLYSQCIEYNTGITVISIPRDITHGTIPRETFQIICLHVNWTRKKEYLVYSAYEIDWHPEFTWEHRKILWSKYIFSPVYTIQHLVNVCDQFTFCAN